MPRRVFLPLSDLPRAPTVDRVRKQLGGRAATAAGAGELVRVTSANGLVRAGVVLFVEDDTRDVWIADSAVVRVTRADCEPLEIARALELAGVSNDARTFGSLSEGQRVRFRQGERLDEGRVVEKCRYGALVERADGSIVGVGFRRLWPDDRPQN